MQRERERGAHPPVGAHDPAGVLDGRNGHGRREEQTPFVPAGAVICRYIPVNPAWNYLQFMRYPYC